MLLKTIIMIIVFLGVIGTLLPKVNGTLIILAGALIYWSLTNFQTYTPGLAAGLVGLSAVAELGGRYLRVYLTRRFQLARNYGTDATVGHLAGLIVTDVMFGPLLGALLWEIVVGKALLPRWNTIAKLLLRLCLAALLRLLCGVIMSILVIRYLFLP